MNWWVFGVVLVCLNDEIGQWEAGWMPHDRQAGRLMELGNVE